ncbi:MAG TPA: CsbD family protein [Propionibacteriaceae bacterium]|nr:CsbD family protein [Propionibacteriaceae bacterium]
MSIDSHDDKFLESDRPDDRSLGEKIRDAAEEAGDKVKESWDDLTDDERLEREAPQTSGEGYGRHDIPADDLTDANLGDEAAQPSGEGYGRHDIDPADDLVDPAVDPDGPEGDSSGQSGEGYGRHDTDRRDNPVDPAFDPVIRFDER